MQKPNPILIISFVVAGALSFLGLASLSLKITAGVGPRGPSSIGPETTPIQFIDRGRVIKTVTKAELLAIFKPVEQTIFEQREGHEVTYSAIPADKLLAWAFGKDSEDVPRWTKAHNLAFKSYALNPDDSHASFVPTSRLARFPAYFAVSRKDAPNFTVRNDLQGGEVTNLAPLSLIWANKGNSQLLKEGAVFVPNQLTTIELADDPQLFANILPAVNSPEAVRRGFAVFKNHCVFCHSIGRSSEETMGGDLLRVPSCSDGEKVRLKSWILDPRDPNVGDGSSPMNSLLEVEGNRETAVQKADDVLVYLCAMDRARDGREK